MKPLHILPALIVTLAACTPEPPPAETQPPTPPVESPPPETTAAPTPPPPPVTRHTGIIDWSFYERWAPEPPQLVVVERLDPSTRALLREKTTLLHKVLEPPPPPSGPDKDAIQAQLDQLKKRFPVKNTTSYQRRDPSGKVTTVSVILETGLWNSYRSMWSQLSLGNIDSVLTNIERRIARDQEQARAGVSGSDGLAHQARLALAWLGQLSRLVAEARRIQLDLEATPRPTGPNPREEWAAWEEKNMAVLLQVIEQNKVGQYPLGDDNTYELDESGEILVLIHIAGRPIYLHEKTPGHRLRFFNQQTIR